MALRSGHAFSIAAAVAFFLVPAPHLYAQEQCQCSAPGGEDSRIASAIGGGLFAGLIAAVIPFHHAAALASAPAAGAAPSALTTMSDSTDIAPADSSSPRQVASVGSLPGDGAPSYAAGGPRPLASTARSDPAIALPTMSPEQAEADGMLAPKTATILPALAMIGVGAMLLGIFFLRIRRPHSRSH